MDAQHFDAIVRALTRGPSRRGLLTGLLGGLLAPLSGWSLDEGMAKKAKKGKKKKKKKAGQCKAAQEKCGKACCTASQTCIAGKCLGACQFTVVDNDNEKTMTLQANCATTETIVIPDGFTLEGNGKTIHMAGPVSGYQAVAPAGDNVRAGLLIQNGTGTVKNVTVDQDALQCAAGLTTAAIAMAEGRGDIDAVEIVLTKNDRNCYRSGISAQVAGNNDAINIRNVTITGNRFAGIAVSGPAVGNQAVAGVISDCTITGPGFGMVLSDSKHQVTGNTVTANVGITVGSQPSVVTIDDNEIRGLSQQANLFGVNFGEFTAGTLSNNRAISGFTCGVAIQPNAFFDQGDITGNTFSSNTTDICDPP